MNEWVSVFRRDERGSADVTHHEGGAIRRQDGLHWLPAKGEEDSRIIRPNMRINAPTLSIPFFLQGLVQHKAAEEDDLAAGFP